MLLPNSCPILQLPDEILQIILCDVRAATSYLLYIDVMLVCRRFSTVGRPAGLHLLYLADATFDNWLHSTKYIGFQYAPVKHLTVELSAEHPEIISKNLQAQLMKHHLGWKGMEECGVHCRPCDPSALSGTGGQLVSRLKSLALIVRNNMPRITTFALIINAYQPGHPWCPCYGLELQPELFTGLIDALPDTCESLMLDTGGCDWDSNSSRSSGASRLHVGQLCDAVAQKMKSLKHVWLRIASLCPWFFLPGHNNFSRKWDLTSPIEKFCSENHDLRFLPQAFVDSTMYAETTSSIDCMNWNLFPTVLQQPYVYKYKRVLESLQNPNPDLLFPFLESCTVNLATFPLFQGRQKFGSAPKIATSLSIAIQRWRIFPRMLACHVIDQHMERFSDKEFDQLYGLDVLASEPSCGNLTEMFVFDVMFDETTVLPFRCLMPESQASPDWWRGNAMYAYYGLYSEIQHYGSFEAFELLIEDQMLGGWIRASNPKKHERIRIPRTVGSSISGLNVENDETRGWTRDKLYELITERTHDSKWLARADASERISKCGLLNHLEVRHPATGQLGTQRAYKVSDVEEV